MHPTPRIWNKNTQLSSVTDFYLIKVTNNQIEIVKTENDQTPSKAQHIKPWLPVKYSRLFEHIAKIDVRIQKVGIQLHCFFEMMYGEPDFTLRIEDATQIWPSNRKLRLSFYCLQVTNLEIGINVLQIHEETSTLKKYRKQNCLLKMLATSITLGLVNDKQLANWIFLKAYLTASWVRLCWNGCTLN